MGCNDPVVGGQEYVMLDILGASPLHVEHLGDDEDHNIVGFKTGTINRYGIIRKVVYCKRLNVALSAGGRGVGI